MTDYYLEFSRVIKEKVKDYGFAMVEFQNRLSPKLQSLRPGDWGAFHSRLMTVLIEGSDIKKRADIYSRFGHFTFADLKHLILELEVLSKHFKWIKGNDGNSRWFFPCYNALIDLENEASFLRRQLVDLNRSESQRQKRLSSV